MRYPAFPPQYRSAEQRIDRPERIKLLVLLMLMLGLAGLAHAEQTLELSDDFLEYLGNMESNEDNWTDFAAEKSVASTAISSSATAAKDSAVAPAAGPPPTMVSESPTASAPRQITKSASATATTPKASQ